MGKNHPLLPLCFYGFYRNEANQELNQRYHIEMPARRQASRHTMEDYTILIPMNFLYYLDCFPMFSKSLFCKCIHAIFLFFLIPLCFAIMCSKGTLSGASR